LTREGKKEKRGTQKHVPVRFKKEEGGYGVEGGMKESRGWEKKTVAGKTIYRNIDKEYPFKE